MAAEVLCFASEEEDSVLRILALHNTEKRTNFRLPSLLLVSFCLLLVVFLLNNIQHCSTLSLQFFCKLANAYTQLCLSAASEYSALAVYF